MNEKLIWNPITQSVVEWEEWRTEDNYPVRGRVGRVANWGQLPSPWESVKSDGLKTITQSVEECEEWRTEESEVSGSIARPRFLLLEQKPVLHHKWWGVMELHALYR